MGNVIKLKKVVIDRINGNKVNVNPEQEIIPFEPSTDDEVERNLKDSLKYEMSEVT